MDVQTENMDPPPPCESQSSGKIRKGFKLFGKRKPGNIFSIRSKGDGNNKSPVSRSKTIDGLSETAAQDSEQESDREKGQEESQGEREQADEEPLGEDGVLAAAPGRASISSVSSARSLSFLSLLRGGRREVGDRRVHTVSQPAGRHRRGLKGLFNNVKFRSKDKEEKEEAPPSPLLMLSRANSVEIIKEDLPLTPKCQPRFLVSPKTESYEPDKSLSTEDSTATSPSEIITSKVTTGNVSRTNEHVPPLPTSEPPLVPGDNSLSCLLADISSLLTFDSISGGGDIMADVEAEWGRASSPIGAAVTEVTPSFTSLFSKPTIPCPLTSVSTAAPTKPCPVATPTKASTQSFTPLAKTTTSSSPISKPSSIITTLTKSSTLTTNSIKLSLDSTSASEPSTSIQIKSTPTPITTKPLTIPVTLTSLSAPIMSPPSMTIKSTLSSTSTTTTAPPNTIAKAPSISPPLTCTAGKLASQIAAPPQIIASVSKSIPVATPTPASAKPLPVTHSPPTPVTFTQPPPAKLDLASSLNLQTFTSYKPFLSSAAGESKAPVIISPACAVTTKPSSAAPVISSKMTTVPTSTTTSSSASATLSKPTLTSSPMDLNKTPPLASVPYIYPFSTPTATTRTQPSPASVPTPSSTFSDKIPSMTKPTYAPLSLDKTPPAPTSTPTPILTTHAVFTASPTPPPPGQIPFSQSKAPPATAQIPISVPKDPPTPAPMQVSQSKAPPATAQIPISVPKDPLTPAPMVSQSKAPPATAQISISVPKDPPTPAPMQVSQFKAPPASAQIPISVPKDPLTPAPMQVSQSKYPPASAQIPISVPNDPLTPAPMQVSQSKYPPASAQIPIAVPKDPLTPAPMQVSQSKAPPASAQIPMSVPKDPSTPAQILVSVSKPPSAPAQIPIPMSKDMPAPAHIPVSQSRAPPAPFQIPVSVSKEPPAPARVPVSVSIDLPDHVRIPVSVSIHPPAQIPVSQPKAPSAPTPAPCPVTSHPFTPTSWPSESPATAKMRGSGQASIDGKLTSPSSTGAQTLLSKTEELQGPSRERRIPQLKASALSKIPVVGGGRGGKLPVRDSQHADGESSRDPPTTPVLEEERPHLIKSHDAGSKDKISDVHSNLLTSKYTQEESQQLPQPKVLTSLPRDSKIPVKHGAQSHNASQIPQAKEPSRTKIPVSKVPVRRAGNKPAAGGGSTQIRK
ncbi:mucin-17-like [Cottoperca gobio]|uniref:Mucin-17-like n=1 Tax=Cottoperca gobio TaxID=56716 RepID=A0A6J2R120_COTGO|nr:mucin-17-like [Cottoperca gobio]